MDEELVLIRTERASTPVPRGSFEELVERLRDVGRYDVADELVERKAFADENKAFVYSLLSQWLIEDRHDEFGSELRGLRYELDWDTGNRD